LKNKSINAKAKMSLKIVQLLRI